MSPARLALLDFFAHTGTCDKISSEVNGNYEDWNKNRRNGLMVLLHGPSNSGKTSMLLQYAFMQAKTGAAVEFIMLRSDDENTKPSICAPIIPCSACDKPIPSIDDNRILKSIKIKYLGSAKELREYCSRIRRDDNSTSVLILDQLSAFMKDASPVEWLRTLACLAETPVKSTLVVTDLTSQVQAHCAMYERWFHITLVSTTDQKNDDVYILKEHSEISKKFSPNQIVKYRFTTAPPELQLF